MAVSDGKDSLGDGEALDMTLPQALEKWVARQPEKRLWIYLDDAGCETNDSVTYRELDEKTRSLGESLLAGTKGRPPLLPGDRVVLVYPPSIHFAVAFVACIRVGLVAVPVYPPDPRKLWKDMQAFSTTTASCGARVALTSSSYNHMKKAAVFKARLTGERKDSRWPDHLQWLVTDKPLPDPSRPPGASVAAETPANVGVGVSGTGDGGLDRSALAFLQYTSGSTGDPKGVKISHGNLAHNLGAIIRELKAGSDTVVVSWLPQYHDMGLIGSLLGTLYCGGTGYYLSPLDFVRSPPTYITAAAKYRATHLQAPNFAYALCARKWKALKTQPSVDLSSVVHMINAAEPIDAGSIDAFEAVFRPLGLREGVIKPTYGLAEHTVFVCSGGEQRLTVDKQALEVDKEVKLAPDGEARGDATAWCVLVGCGFPSRVKGLELLIVEPNNLGVLPEDTVGEVWLRSPSKAHGYWGLPDESREAFCAMPTTSQPLFSAGAPKPATIKLGDNDTTTPSHHTDLPKDQAEQSTGGATNSILAGGGENGYSGPEIKTDAELHSTVEGVSGSGEGGAGDRGGAGGNWSEGYLRTGDEGFIHRGELFICGRIKDLVIVAGRNHYPQDLERTAERGRNETLRPGCTAAFSVPGAIEGGGELLVITAELREAQTKVPAAQQQALAEDIRSTVSSEHGVDVHDLLLLAPHANVKTTSGKIARHWCRRAFLDGKMKSLVHLTSAITASSGSNNATTASGESNESGSTAHPVGAAGGGGGRVGVPEAREGGQTCDGKEGEGGAPAIGGAQQVDVSTMGDDELLSRLQQVLAGMGDGGLPPPDAPFYSLGLTSMTTAQFSGFLEQDYGVRVPLSLLDADDFTLRKLVPIVKAGGVPAAEPTQSAGSGAAGVPAANSAAAGAAGGRVSGVNSGEVMVRESPGCCEETITNSCPCCLCLLLCPCCS